MSVKKGIAAIVGSRITAVVVSRNSTYPHQQVFLVLDDRWQYELYGSDLNSASDVREADAKRTVEYARMFSGAVTTYGVTGEGEAGSGEPHHP